MTVERLNIPTGTEGLRYKLQRLRGMVREACADPQWRQWCATIVRHAPEKDWDAEARAVSQFVRRVRYTRDPVGVELFTEPRTLAGMVERGEAFGDCDDAALLGAAMLEAVGHPTRFVVGGHRGPMGGQPAWAHIWLEWRHPRRGWQALDDTAKQRPPGWRPDSHFASLLREAPNMYATLPSSVDLATWPVELGGLSGGFGKKLKKLKKLGSKVATVTGAKKLGQVATKLGKKALPVAAMVAPVIPGVGVVASAGLAAAAAAVKQRQMKQRARKAIAAQAAWEAAEAAQSDVEPVYGAAPEYAALPAPTSTPYSTNVLPVTADQMRTASEYEEAQDYAPPIYPEAEAVYAQPYYGPSDADGIEPEYAQEVYGLGWFDSLISTVTSAAESVMPYAQQVLPALQQAAESGAFGRRGRKLASKATALVARPGFQAAVAAGRGVARTYQQQQRATAPTAPTRVARSSGGSGGGAGVLLLGGLALLMLSKKGKR